MLICRWGKHSEISPASRAVYYSKSVGPWTRVKIDDKTKGKKPIFMQLTSKALVHCMKTSVAKPHLNELIDIVHGNLKHVNDCFAVKL